MKIYILTASASTYEVEDPSGNLLPPLMGSETSINNNNVKNEDVAEVKEKKQKSKPMQKKVKHEQKHKKSSDNLHQLVFLFSISIVLYFICIYMCIHLFLHLLIIRFNGHFTKQKDYT